MKKAIKYFIIIIAGFILAILLLPFVFQEDIKDGVKQALNESLQAKVDFQDIGLDFWRDFPNAHLVVDKLQIIGIDTFLNVPLFDADKIHIEIGLGSLLKKNTPYDIKSLQIDKANLNLVTLDKGIANYLIIKPSEDVTVYNIDLKDYRIKDSKLHYQDLTSALEVYISQINHSGYGNFNQSSYDLNTTTTSSDFNLKFKGIPYLTSAVFDADAVIKVDLENNKYTFQNNNLTLNAFPFKINGYTQLMEEDIILDLTLVAPNSDFSQLYSLIPLAYNSDFESAQINGNGSIDGFVKGTYNSLNNKFPAYKLDIGIDNGSVKYNRLPHPISDIQTKISLFNKDGNSGNLEIDIPEFRFKIQEDYVRGHFTSEGIENPSFDGSLMANINLQKWKESFPLSTNSIFKGKGEIDLRIQSDLKSIKTNRFDKIKFSTDSKLENVEIQLEDQFLFKAAKIALSGNPASFDAHAEDLFIKNSDFSFDFSIKNPLNVLVDKSRLEGILQVESKRILLDSLFVINQPMDTLGSSNDLKLFGNLVFNGSADEVVFENQVYKYVSLNGASSGDHLTIDEGKAQVSGSDILLSGEIKNINQYINNSSPLKGNLNLVSSNFIIDPWLEDDLTTQNDSIFLLPPNLDINLNFKIETLKYLGLVLNNIKANAIAGNRSFQIRSATSEALGGGISLEGLYSTMEGKNPNFDFKFDLSDLQFQQAFQKIRTFQAIAPIAQYISGKFNTTLLMNGSLTNQMLPVWQELNASGFIETFESAISGYGPLKKVGDKIGIDQLRTWTIGNTKNWFEIVDGMVELKENTFSLGNGISISVAGKHGIGKIMDYDIYLEIPRQLMQKNKVAATADQGLVFLENQASKLGINLQQGENIVLKIDLKGKLNDPELSIAPIGTSGKNTNALFREKVSDEKIKVENKAEDLKEIISDTLRQAKEKAIDSLKQSIKNKTTDILDSLSSKNGSKLDSMFNKILKDSTSSPIKDQIKKEENKIKNALEKWNPLKKKKKPDTTKINF